MAKWLENSKPTNVHAVLVARHGTLTFEHYFAGEDEHWGTRSAKSRSVRE
jgi:hypothetical protein